LPKASRALEFERLLGIYYDIANRSVIENGGTVSKLTGDGLMAYFKAGDSVHALNAAIEICRRLEDVRSGAPLSDPAHYLYAGVGLCAGQVREGNVGSVAKFDYTLLGDSVNSAARLEGVSRKVNPMVIFDDSLLKHMDKPSALKKLGLYQAKGKTENMSVYTVDYPYTSRKISLVDLKTAIAKFRNGSSAA
jgi:adenylate cyclase